jgi:hypothetical protein
VQFKQERPREWHKRRVLAHRVPFPASARADFHTALRTRDAIVRDVARACGVRYWTLVARLSGRRAMPAHLPDAMARALRFRDWRALERFVAEVRSRDA